MQSALDHIERLLRAAAGEPIPAHLQGHSPKKQRPKTETPPPEPPAPAPAPAVSDSPPPSPLASSSSAQSTARIWEPVVGNKKFMARQPKSKVRTKDEEEDDGADLMQTPPDSSDLHTFLEDADLASHVSGLVDIGVTSVHDLQYVEDADLLSIGLQKSEVARLWSKLAEHGEGKQSATENPLQAGLL